MYLTNSKFVLEQKVALKNFIKKKKQNRFTMFKI